MASAFGGNERPAFELVAVLEMPFDDAGLALLALEIHQAGHGGRLEGEFPGIVGHPILAASATLVAHHDAIGRIGEVPVLEQRFPVMQRLRAHWFLGLDDGLDQRRHLALDGVPDVASNADAMHGALAIDQFENGRGLHGFGSLG